MIHVENVELAVTVGHFHSDASLGPRGRAPHLCYGVFKAMRETDLGSVLVARMRIDNRRAL